jgi:hypothetical protein
MGTRTISLRTIALIAGTRGMLGAGIGLLAAGRLDRTTRRRVGRTLVAIGVASTVPLLMHIRRAKAAAAGATTPREV